MRKVLILFGVAFTRIWGRLRSPDARRVLLTSIGVALAVGLMTTVSGISLGLAAGTTVQSSSVDYWIMPESAGASSIAVSVDGPKLGNVHTVSAQLERDDRVTYVTPLQLSVLQFRAGNTTDYVLAVGLIPPADNRTVAGLPVGQLTPGDPHYANGTYNGTWTGEAILSDAAADVLTTESGKRLQSPMAANRSFTATQITQGDLSGGLGPIPIVLVHLSELQTLTGTDTGDQADQLLVSTNSPALKSELQNVYPRTRVIASSGLTAPEVSTDSLPLAVAVAALLAVLVVGTLFVATLMGLEITADRTNIAAMAAIGLSWRSRALLVVFETVLVSVFGGCVGVVLGVGGIALVNHGARAILGVGKIARFNPVLIGYGIGIAALIGVLAAPYPIWVSYRTEVLEVLSE